MAGTPALPMGSYGVPAMLACLGVLGAALFQRLRSPQTPTLAPLALAAVHSGRLAPLRAASPDTPPDPETPRPSPPTEPSQSASSTGTPAKGKDEFDYLKFNDPIAAMSRFIGRRFGLAGALGFVGIIAAVEGNEILQALLEPEAQEGTGEIITLPSGVQYTDLKVGGGRAEPQKGYLIGAKFLVLTGEGQLVYDSTGAKPLAFKYQERPLVGLICEGLEEGVAGIRVGGVRRITVPPSRGFGAEPKRLRGDYVLPPNSTLIYQIEVVDIVPFYT